MIVSALWCVADCVSTVVARYTVARDAGVIPGATLECRCGMTEVTIQIGAQVVNVLTGRGITIVTGDATISNP